MKKKYIVTQSNGGALITLQFPNKKILKVIEGDVVELELKDYINFKHVFMPLDDYNEKMKKREEKIVIEVIEEPKETEIDLTIEAKLDEPEYPKPKEKQPIPEGKLPEEVKEQKEKIELLNQALKMKEKYEKDEDLNVFSEIEDDIVEEKIDFDSLSYKELKKLCTENNLDLKGKKSVLLDRLKEYFDKNNWSWKCFC